MLFQHGFLFLAAASGAFADCGLYHRKLKHPTICDGRGYLTKANDTDLVLEAQFYSGTIESCNSRIQSLYGSAFGYNFNTGECQFFIQKLATLGFVRDSSSPWSYSSVTCYNSVTGCGVQNGDFETPNVEGRGVTLIPTGWEPTDYRTQIYLMPWSAGRDVDGNGTYGDSFARINQAGDKPAAQGSNYAFISVAHNEKLFLAQSTRLLGATTYSFTFDYAYFRYIGNKTLANTTYTVEPRFNAMPIPGASFTLDHKNGDADGVWKTHTTTFVTPSRVFDRYVTVAIKGEGDEASAKKTSTFGVDNVIVKPAS